MIHELVHILINNGSVSFSRQDESVIVTVNDNGTISHARFSLEEIYTLSRGDYEACEQIIGEAISGLFEESELKHKRNNKLRDDLAFYLDEIAKREAIEAATNDDRED